MERVERSLGLAPSRVDMFFIFEEYRTKIKGDLGVEVWVDTGILWKVVARGNE